MKTVNRWIGKILARIDKRKEKRAAGRKRPEGASAVLCFHDVSDRRDDVFSVAPQELVRILDAVRTPVLRPDELGSSGEGGTAITFDDGYASVYDTVYPLFRQRGIPFTVYVVTDRIGADGYLTADQIRELARDEAICTVGSHMCSHRKTREMTAAEIRREWAESRRILEEITGRPVRHAALPYGKAASCSRKSIRMGLRAGYRTVATTLAVPCRGGSVLPRYVYQNDRAFAPALFAKGEETT